MKILGIDIGGSALKGAPVDTETGRMLAERYRIETPEQLTPAKIGRRRRAGETLPVARADRHPAFPGVIQQGRIRTAANLHPKFVGCDARALFGKATGCRVEIGNDAEAAALAEMKFGAGKGFAGMTLVLVLGTGVGSVLAYRGVCVPLRVPGHLPYKGKGAEKHVAASVRKAKNLTWPQWGGRLNHYLQYLELFLWPELIIIGGGVSAKHDKFFPYLHTRARVVPAKLQNGAGTGSARRSTLYSGLAGAPPEKYFVTPGSDSGVLEACPLPHPLPRSASAALKPWLIAGGARPRAGHHRPGLEQEPARRARDAGDHGEGRDPDDHPGGDGHEARSSRKSRSRSPPRSTGKSPTCPSGKGRRSRRAT